MSSQPPARPWFRLASISRPQPAPAPAPAPTPAPAPAPATQSRPSIIARPAFRPVAPPQEPTPSPPPPPPYPPTPTVTTSPQQQEPSESRAPPSSIRAPSMPSSPRLRPTVPTPSQPAIRAPSAPSSPSIRPAAPTTSLPQISTTMGQSPQSAMLKQHEIPLPSWSVRKYSPPSSSSSSSNTAVSSPEVVKPAPLIPSPKFMPAATPPSPLVLPPSQIREGEPKIPPVAEQQKAVLVQKSVEKPKPSHDEPFKPNLARPASRAGELKDKVKSSARKHLDSEDGSGTTIITIAGDNTGAVMDIGHSPKKHAFPGKPHFLFNKDGNVQDKMLSDDTESESSSNSSSRKLQKANKTKQSLPLNAYMNSNVQGINNSIVYNSSCSHNDPGVHLVMTKKPADGGFLIKKKPNVYHRD